MVFQERYKVDSRKIEGCFEVALRVFKDIQKKFKGCFKEI